MGYEFEIESLWGKSILSNRPCLTFGRAVLLRLCQESLGQEQIMAGVAAATVSAALEGFVKAATC